MNVQLLQQVKQHILTHPGRFCAAQWAWARNANEVIDRGDAPQGFRCCIAGHVLLLGGRFDERGLLRHSVRCDDGYLGRQASEALQLTEQQRKELFYPSIWAEPFRSQYYLTQGPEAEAGLCAAYIDHFLEQHGPAQAPGLTERAEDRPAQVHQAHPLAVPSRAPARR